MYKLAIANKYVLTCCKLQHLHDLDFLMNFRFWSFEFPAPKKETAFISFADVKGRECVKFFTYIYRKERAPLICLIRETWLAFSPYQFSVLGGGGIWPLSLTGVTGVWVLSIEGGVVLIDFDLDLGIAIFVIAFTFIN
jgi:hypothetical protein